MTDDVRPGDALIGWPHTHERPDKDHLIYDCSCEQRGWEAGNRYGQRVAENYRDALHKERREGDELARKLSRRSVDDIYLLLLAVIAVTVGLIAAVV